jgi:pentatricopeptide repeat protein
MYGGSPSCLSTLTWFSRFTYILRRATRANPVSEPQWPMNDVGVCQEVFDWGRKHYSSNNYLWAEMIASCTRAKRTDLAIRVYEEWRALREQVGMDGGLGTGILCFLMVRDDAHCGGGAGSQQL